jgi:hypothetical protein
VALDLARRGERKLREDLDLLGQLVGRDVALQERDGLLQQYGPLVDLDVP